MKYRLVENSNIRAAFWLLWENLTFGWFFGYRVYPRDWKKRGYLQPMQRMVGLGPVRVQWASKGPILRTVNLRVTANTKRPPMVIE